MIRRWLALLLACLFPLQNVAAAGHDYVDHFPHGAGSERFVFHGHEVEEDSRQHRPDPDHACSGESQHEGEIGHSHSPHAQLVLSFRIPVPPTLDPATPPGRPLLYASVIPERLDRPPHDARR